MTVAQGRVDYSPLLVLLKYVTLFARLKLTCESVGAIVGPGLEPGRCSGPFLLVPVPLKLITFFISSS